MSITLLANFGTMENDAIPGFPQAALCDEASPNIGHSERTAAR
jgi:hypothetical protein